MNPGLQSILVSVTEGCRVGCHHCGFKGSARAASAGPSEVAAWVGQVCNFGVPVVIFTGGEPFETFEALRAGVVEAHRKHVPSAVFTSSFWGTSPESALQTLRQLPGLDHLYLSSDIYHQRRVPYENVFNVVRAGLELEVPRISICITYASESDRLQVRSRYESFGDAVMFFEERVIPTPHLRADLLERQDPLRSPREFSDTCWIDTPIINPTGDVFSCHSGKAGAHGNLEHLPYWLGNLHRDSFDVIMQRSRRRLDYQYLRTHGPAGIAALLEAFPELYADVKRDGFTGPCDMCVRVLSEPRAIRALHEYVMRPEVRLRINLALALRFGEAPVADPVGIDVTREAAIVR